MGIVLYVFVTLLYAISAYQLISVKNDQRTVGSESLLYVKMKAKERSSNDYASLCYDVLGPGGYYVFLIASILDLYGGIIGTLVVMTDFLCSLPIFTFHPKVTRFVLQACITLLCIVICLLKNPK